MATVYTIKDTRFIFATNFTGAPSQFNPKGEKPNCNIVLDEENAAMLLDAGFRVKTTKPREDGSEYVPEHYINLKCSFGGLADPDIRMVPCPPGEDPRECPQIKLTADTVGNIDTARVARVDVSFADYHHRMGVSGYIRKMIVVVVPDELDLEWGF